MYLIFTGMPVECMYLAFTCVPGKRYFYYTLSGGKLRFVEAFVKPVLDYFNK